MAEKKIKNKRLNVKVSETLYSEFKKVVEAKGCQVSYEVREMMKRYIREYKKG